MPRSTKNSQASAAAASSSAADEEVEIVDDEERKEATESAQKRGRSRARLQQGHVPPSPWRTWRSTYKPVGMNIPVDPLRVY